MANELTLVALLVCMAVSDLCAPACDRVFATDASLSCGAVCSAPIDEGFSQFLWRVSRSKGAYHRLLTPLQVISHRLGLLEEVGDSSILQVSRPIAFCYDFIEIFSGASTVTAAVAALVDLWWDPRLTFRSLKSITCSGSMWFPGFPS